MNKKKFFVVWMLAVAANIFLFFPLKDLRAEDSAAILQHLKDKYAGYNREIQDATVSQETRIQTPQGELLQQGELFKKGQKFRMNSTVEMSAMAGAFGKNMPKMETTIIYDGRNTWMISPFNGKQMLSPEMSAQYQFQKDPANFLEGDVEVLGTDTVEGRECYEIHDKEQNPMMLWVDKNTDTIVQMKFGTDDNAMRAVFSDFRKIKADWEVPYATKIYQNQELVSTMTVKSYQVNTGVSDDLFNPDLVKAQGVDLQAMMQKLGQQSGQ